MCNHVRLLTQSVQLWGTKVNNSFIFHCVCSVISWLLNSCEENGASHFLARKAGSLKKTKGLLADPEKKREKLVFK